MPPYTAEHPGASIGRRMHTPPRPVPTAFHEAASESRKQTTLPGQLLSNSDTERLGSRIGQKLTCMRQAFARIIRKPSYPYNPDLSAPCPLPSSGGESRREEAIHHSQRQGPSAKYFSLTPNFSWGAAIPNFSFVFL